MTYTIDTILDRAFVSLSAEQQAEVLNAAGELAARTWTSDAVELDMQACMIAGHLRHDAWRLLATIMKFAPKDVDR